MKKGRNQSACWRLIRLRRGFSRNLVWCPVVLPRGFSSLGVLPLGASLHLPPFLVATSLKACHHLAQMDGQRAGNVKQDVQMVGHQLPGNDGYLGVVVRNAVDLVQHRGT